MSVDPRTPIVQVMARLGRETQLHLDERHHHFKITDKVILVVSLLLVLLATINVYYVTVLYGDLDGIVSNMDSMYRNLERVDHDMEQIAGRVERLHRHIAQMRPIADNMHAITQVMPLLRENMDNIQAEMGGIDGNMLQIAAAMGGIAFEMRLMTSGMAVMRQNVHQIAGPMGAFNPVLPY